MTTPAFVQNTANGHNATDGTTPKIHFGSNVTVGNLLVCVVMMYDGNGAYSNPTGWTIDSQQDGSGTTTMITAVVYRYAQSGDAKDFTLDTATGRNYWAINAWEVSGVSGTWATDKQAVHLNADSGTYPVKDGPLTSFTTGAASCLLLGGWTGNSVTGTSGSLTDPGATADATFEGSDTALCFARGDHSTRAGSTTIGAGGTVHAAQGNNSNFEYAYIELISAAAATETSTGEMDFAGISFAGASGRTETTTGEMDFHGIGFNGAGSIARSSTGVMSFAGITIVATGLDFVPGGGFTFSTFGA